MMEGEIYRDVMEEKRERCVRGRKREKCGLG